MNEQPAAPRIGIEWCEMCQRFHPWTLRRQAAHWFAVHAMRYTDGEAVMSHDYGQEQPA